MFRQIICDVTDAFFPIGPLRKILSDRSTTATPFDDRVLPDDPEYDRDRFAHAESERQKAFAQIRPDKRYVGHDGQYTQELHAYWAYNLLRQPLAPYCGQISNEFENSEFIYEDFSPSLLLASLPDEFRSHVLSLVDSDLRSAWQQVIDRPQRELTAIKILNHVMKSRDLFRREFRPVVYGEVESMIGATPVIQDERFSSRRLLSNDEIQRVNRLLLEATFDEHADKIFRLRPEYDSGVYANRDSVCRHRTGYLFETFVSYWMKHLCHTPIQYMGFKGGPLDRLWASPGVGELQQPPNGGLTGLTREWQSCGLDGRQIAARDEADEDLVDTVRPPTTRSAADWSIMSTGFHQLAPIVVQAGLLSKNEIMAVENPEAHLHPSLQIKVAEFLMQQANAGKVMLIETHSDLFVRRILRAIREEDVGHVSKGQAAVSICFTKLVTDPSDENPPDEGKIKYATISEFTLNGRGQIEWPNGFPPDGFMTDSLDEARRFVDAATGDESEDENESTL